MEIRFHHIEARTLVDGPGNRAALFMQGCKIHCPGCQNTALWDMGGGKEVDTRDIAVTLAGLSKFVTITGGEPFAQPAALATLVCQLKTYGVEHIIVYSGYTLDQLLDPKNAAAMWLFTILRKIDVLVDGPFIAKDDDGFIAYRGSRNQRVIDVPASVKAGQAVLLDWDAIQIMIDPDGNILAPVGLTGQMAEIGSASAARRCGEVDA